MTEPILLLLSDYEKFWCDRFYPGCELSEEKKTLHQYRKFVLENPNCFLRSLSHGHITGSSFVVSSDLARVLLVHHRKLGIWVQLGGHADGDCDIERVALKEAEEESGIQNLRFYPFDEKFPFSKTPPLLDIDIHQIPQNKNDNAHDHYDARFLLVADSEKVICSHESIELKWFDLSEVKNVTRERSVLRPIQKIQQLTSR